MILHEGTIVYSATDLTAAATCEWALVRKLDWMLGRAPKPPSVEDDMLVRAGLLGDLHERRVLDELKRTRTVVEIERPVFGRGTGSAGSSVDPGLTLAEATGQTREALEGGAEVVFQAAFFDGRFLGYADFIMRTDEGLYEVYDTKLARKAKITALLQLAAYSDQLERLGIPIGETVHLWLGDGSLSSHRLADILPVYRRRRGRLQAMLDDRMPVAPDIVAIEWGDPRHTACGRCDACAEQVTLHRDVLLVAGMRLTQRAKLRRAGVETIEQLAGRADRVEGLPDSTLRSLGEQAQIQLETPFEGAPAWRVANAAALEALPAPDDGDIFFDFEGDPLHEERGVWGLDYLFGLVEGDETFREFWADDLPQEKRALEEFLAYLRVRRAEHPGMHVYHYASYERTHLLTLAARHGVGEEEIDELLRQNVLVDLYPIVRQGLRIGSRSYSLKKLEPLYMGDRGREGTANAADSITEYVRYTELQAAGEYTQAAGVRADIARYNEYDCVSTLRLRDWLVSRLAEHRQEQRAAGRVESQALQGLEPEEEPRQPDPVYTELMAALGAGGIGSGMGSGLGFGSWSGTRTGMRSGSGSGSGSGDGTADAFERRADAFERPADAFERTADETALALAAAAIDYHRRESKSFWWEHFNRLANPIDEWADTRGVFVIDHARVERDWSRLPKARSDSRELVVTGTAGPGSRFGDSEQPFALYDQPAPDVGRPGTPGSRAAHSRTSFVALPATTTPVSPALPSVPEGGAAASGLERHRLTERLPLGGETYSDLPVAITPASPPSSATLAAAISEWGAGVVEALPAMLPDAALDILRRAEPRVPRLVRGDDTIESIRSSLLQLDRSYIAVQGPPGTGKTHTGARVIAELVAKHGWRVGVVAQSHATVENMLAAIIGAGVPADRVGKKPKAGTHDADGPVPPWASLTDPAMPGFIAQEGGLVLGGTQWTFANPKYVPRHALDLLVIDEAGQFSLASTIAVSVSATRLLLLGDPQQLPQVSQGTHPEPVDESALGWLSAGHDVLPAEFGYFLDTSWRMHPAVCAPVSKLSYEGRLHSHGSDRHLEGVQPGFHPVPVQHSGNSTSSTEEAAVVLDTVRALIGHDWTSAKDATAPLAPSDIIVIAPYNAQVEVIRSTLAVAGFDATTVGTADAFQGREAAVAIVSLAASAADDVPRGLEFLLLANRLNVAISRAQWAAYLVYSPALADHLPTTPQGLAQLSAFIELVDPPHPAAEASLVDPPHSAAEASLVGPPLSAGWKDPGGRSSQPSGSVC